VTLAGKTCVVTGASRGLGRAIAEFVASQGATLALCARTAADLDATAAALRDTWGADVITRALDVRDEKALRAFAATVAAEAPPVHALVNNAGVLGPVGRVDTVPLAEWQDAFAVNVVGVVAATAVFVPLMPRGGSIVNLSGGGVGGPGVQSHISAYTSAKGAIAVLTETLADELAPLGIRVNAIAPGALRTELMRAVLDAGPERAGDALFETARAIYGGDDAPNDETTLADDCRALLEFLLDDASAAITGRVLSARWDPVDELRAQAETIAGRSRYRLRRIDDEWFREAERP
jgi:3-oxoacyl-[acyl-carrier protein] reductase